jgi:hypothetical protein
MANTPINANTRPYSTKDCPRLSAFIMFMAYSASSSYVALRSQILRVHSNLCAIPQAETALGHCSYNAVPAKFV